MDTATLQRFAVALVRRDGPGLSARQLAVLLTVYRTEGPHTVRGLAKALGVYKAAITRALDRLGALNLVRRAVDPMDRRSVLVQRTIRGAMFLCEMDEMLADAGRGAPRAEAGR